MNKIDIFNLIIDKYEKSSKFKNNEKGTLSINLYNNNKYLSSDNRKDLNLELNNSALLKIKWLEFNNIIEKITFNIDDIEYFYLETNRENVDTFFKAKIDLIKSFNFHNDWINTFFDDIILDLNKKKENRYIPRLEELLKCFVTIDQSMQYDQELLMRVYSKKALGNSKTFEKELKGLVMSITKKYNPDITDAMSEDNILQQIGIVKTSNDFYIKGNLTILVDDNIIDLSNFKYGIGLNKDTICNSRILEDNNIKKVISYENKANFLSAKYEKDTLVIFSHGFYSKWEKEFLKYLKIALAEDTKYFHSGDLDLGGFNIYYDIKNNIFPTLQPLDMNIDIYNKFIKYGEIRDDNYINKIKIIENDDFKELKELIIKSKKTIEQEIFLS